MRYTNLAKSIPLLSTLILILFLSISNQKEYTKIRILIWNTPSLPLGTYLAISTGSGFLLSYIVTANLAKIIKPQPKQKLNYKEENKIEFNQTYTNSSYDKTLIERDFNDPSPTVNASFRVIGKIERSNEDSLNHYNSQQYKGSAEFDNEYNEQYEKDENIYQEKSYSSDWNDDSFSNW